MSTTNTARNLERFTIDVDQDILDDLPARLKATRFAPDLDDDEVYGLSARSIKPLVQYWADGDPRRISAHWKAQRSLLPDVSGIASPAAFERMRAKFPTAAIAVLELTGTWRQLSPQTARLTSFVIPRDVRTGTSAGR